MPPPAATLPPGVAPASGERDPRPRSFVPRIVAWLGRCRRAPARPKAQSTCALRPAATLAHTASRDGGAPRAPHSPTSRSRTFPADPRRLRLLGHSCLQSLYGGGGKVNVYLT